MNGTAQVVAIRPGVAGRGPLRAGFTLVELLISISLVVGMFVAVGYIFNSSSRVVSQTQANSELYISAAAFSDTVRELASIQHDGFLVIGRRDNHGFLTMEDQLVNRYQTFRQDFINYTLNTESNNLLDPTGVRQSSRVFVGHGPASSPSAGATIYSKIAADWVLMRAQVGPVPVERDSTVDAAGGAPDETYPRNYWEMFTKRNCQWWFPTLGSASSGSPSRAKEQDFYFYYSTTSSSYYGEAWGKNTALLPHCAEFRVQYAFDSDIKNGRVEWRDPPRDGEASYKDENYRAGTSDTAIHPSQNVATSGQYSGRLAFAPGDPKWPVLLRLSARIVDPLGRFQDSRPVDVIVKLR